MMKRPKQTNHKIEIMLQVLSAEVHLLYILSCQISKMFTIIFTRSAGFKLHIQIHLIVEKCSAHEP